MSKVTSKLQVTLPKAIAEAYFIHPGDEIEWVSSGDSIRVVPAKSLSLRLSATARLLLFDAATERQQEREKGTGSSSKKLAKKTQVRGWQREDLYRRGRLG